MSKSWEISKPKPKSSGGKLKILIIVIVLALAAVAIFAFIHKPNKKAASRPNCNQLYTKQCALKDAVPMLDGTKQAQLKAVTEKIKTIPNYTKDADLMYVVTTYYFNQSDLDNTQRSYDLLVADYKPEVGYDHLLANKAVTPTQMAAKIDFLKQTLTQKPTLFGAPLNE